MAHIMPERDALIAEVAHIHSLLDPRRQALLEEYASDLLEEQWHG